jgi:hypothetical protein
LCALTLAGVVKKLSGSVFKIVHEKFRAKNVNFEADEGNSFGESMAQSSKQQMKEIVNSCPELKPYVTKSQVFLVLFCRFYVCACRK